MPLIGAFVFVERYIQRRKARNEGVFATTAARTIGGSP